MLYQTKSKLPDLRKFIVKRFLLAAAVILALSAWTNELQLLASTETQAEVTSTDVLAFKADLQELASKIKTDHPRPFRFITEADFDQLVASQIDAITATTTEREFLWVFSKILAAIGCGHSNMLYFNQENALIGNEERLPVDVRLVGDRLYVLDALTNQDVLSKGDEIASINGLDVAEIVDLAFQHISGEGVSTTYKKHAFNNYANSYLTYALGFPSEFRLKLVGSDDSILLENLESFRFKPIIHPSNPCQDTLCYRLDKRSDAAIMTIRSFNFYGEDGQVFADYVDRSLADVVDNNRTALIIDIRSHSGGAGLAGAYLLRRLANAPFAYFGDEADTGGSPALFEIQQPVDIGLRLPVYLLVDGNTVSSATHFAALFKAQKMGSIYGEAMGGSKSTNDGARPVKSSMNGVQYKVAKMRFDVVAPEQSINQAIRPDIELAYTIDDILNGTDSMMETLLKKLHKQTTD